MSSYLGKMLFVDLTNKIIEERALLKKMGGPLYRTEGLGGTPLDGGFFPANRTPCS